MKKLLLIVLLLTASYAWAQTFSAITSNGNGYEIYYSIIDASHVEVVRPATNQPYTIIVENIDGFTQCLIIYIPDSVTHNGVTYCVSAIADSAFANVNYSSPADFPGIPISLPQTITSIGRYAFAYNESVTLYMRGSTPPSIDSTTFSALTSPYSDFPLIVVVPCQSENGYSNVWGFDIMDENYNGGEIIGSHMLWINDISIYDMGTIITNNSLSWTSLITVPCSQTTVTIFANPKTGYHFSHWSNGQTANPYTLQLNGDTTIIAIFEPDHNLFTLNVRTADSTLGNVAIVGYEGKSVTFEHIGNDVDTAIIVATPTQHYHLVYWDAFDNMCGYGRYYDNPHQVLFGYFSEDYSETYTAYFAIDTHTVSVASSDIARGRVEGGGLFEYGTPCTVAAEAYSGYHFSHWSNGATYNPYTFAVLEDTELTAVFLAEGEVGIGDVNANDINVYSFGGRIVVVGTTDEVRVFDMTGRSVRNEALPAGVYMVKIGERPARKVVVMR